MRAPDRLGRTSISSGYSQAPAGVHARSPHARRKLPIHNILHQGIVKASAWITLLTTDRVPSKTLMPSEAEIERSAATTAEKTNGVPSMLVTHERDDTALDADAGRRADEFMRMSESCACRPLRLSQANLVPKFTMSAL